MYFFAISPRKLLLLPLRWETQHKHHRSHAPEDPSALIEVDKLGKPVRYQAAINEYRRLSIASLGVTRKSFPQHSPKQTAEKQHASRFHRINSAIEHSYSGSSIAALVSGRLEPIGHTQCTWSRLGQHRRRVIGKTLNRAGLVSLVGVSPFAESSARVRKPLRSAIVNKR